MAEMHGALQDVGSDCDHASPGDSMAGLWWVDNACYVHTGLHALAKLQGSLQSH